MGILHYMNCKQNETIKEIDTGCVDRYEQYTDFALLKENRKGRKGAANLGTWGP